MRSVVLRQWWWHPIAGRPEEDNSDDQLNQEAFFNILAASDQPMLKQFDAFLKAKDEIILALQQQIKTSENNWLTHEAICNYKDTGRSGFNFHPSDAGDVLGNFVFPHIRDLSDQQYFEKLNIASAEPEDFLPAILIIIQLSQQVWNRIFSRNLRDNYMSPPFPRNCLPEILCIDQKSIRRKTNIPFKLHKDCAPVLQVLL